MVFLTLKYAFTYLGLANGRLKEAVPLSCNPLILGIKEKVNNAPLSTCLKVRSCWTSTTEMVGIKMY